MTSIKKLKQLEETRNYVFHGSPNGNIKILEPRQGRHVPDLTKPTESILDGNPAVSATPYTDFAIFRAIINGTNVPFDHSSGFDIMDGEEYFCVSSKKVLEVIKNRKGFVYVFDKKKFMPYDRDRQPTDDSMEWRSYETIAPIEKIKVTSKDLVSRDKIKIISEEEYLKFNVKNE